MKLSLAWIFDHIHADWRSVDVARLVDLFNRKTAEIEGFKKIQFDLSFFTLVTVEQVKKDSIHASSSEHGKSFELPAREGAKPGEIYLIYLDPQGARWATMSDVRSEKESLLPAFYCSSDLLAGGWKKTVESDDYILEVDNKSITNRPDMWGHRGFAREVAALLELELKPLEAHIVPKVIKEYTDTAPSWLENPFTMTVQDSKDCPRFAGLYVDFVENRHAMLPMAFRLARIDARPISYVVDSTNYVMFDLSQPMHAFDAAKITTRHIGPRRARVGEKLQLLDGNKIELTPDDLVIAEGATPLSLAGIMGGVASGVQADTQSLFIESACFDAGVVRKTAARHHVRTDASARFEKTLDPEQNVWAILRLLKIWESDGLHYRAADAIASIGAHAPKKEIVISHAFIQECLGVALTEEFVIKTLRALSFEVAVDGGQYRVTVPSFRASKDIAIKQDIVEEVGRFMGYTNVPFELPKRLMAPFSMTHVLRKRAIKRCLSYALSMHEVATYAMHDETWLRELGFDPTNAIDIQNPVAEQWRRMLTSLVPGLFKIASINKDKHERMRFFEWARVWHAQGDQQAAEKRSVAGIFVDQKNEIDFYTAKQELSILFNQLGMLDIRWVRVDQALLPWWTPYQTAYLMHGDTVIGTAGMVPCTFLKPVLEGSAFFFDLDAEFLLSYKETCAPCRPAPRYPAIERDISILVPLQLTVEDLAQRIQKIDPLVDRVILVDFFQKAEWRDQRSLTFRCVLLDEQQTLTKEHADEIMSKVQMMLETNGAVVR